MKCSPLFPCIESAVPAFKDIRTVVTSASWQRARATWIPDQWLDRESVHREHWHIWYERYSTQKDLSFLSMHSTWVDLLMAFNSLIISVRNIFVAHHPRFQAILESDPRSARNEKAARGSDLNRTRGDCDLGPVSILKPSWTRLTSKTDILARRSFLSVSINRLN